MHLPLEWNVLWRKKSRALLTVGGFACGVFALMLMGALSEHFRMLAAHFRDTFEGRVYICEKLSFWAGGGIIDEDKADEVRKVPGVSDVIPAIIGRLQSHRMVVVGLPLVLVGVPPQQSRTLWRGVSLAEGRWLETGDEETMNALLGSDVAYAFNAQPGGRIHALDRDWNVVGILAHTGAIEDRQMLVSLRPGQKALAREGLLTSMVVLPNSSTDAEKLARLLARRQKTLEVIAPSRMREEVENSLRLWQALILGCGIVAAATGTLCIVITMTVAVTERTYEVGLKKAVGASNGQIAMDFLGEAALLGILGWGCGAIASVLFVLFWNHGFRQEGLFLFALTPRVLMTSAGLALGFGLLAGMLPALGAARLDPVTALRRRL